MNTVDKRKLAYELAQEKLDTVALELEPILWELLNEIEEK